MNLGILYIMFKFKELKKNNERTTIANYSHPLKLKMRTKKKYFIFITILLIILGILFSTSGHYYRKISPDNQFSVYSSIYNYEYLMGTELYFAKGKVFLYDEVKGEIVDECEISRISGTDTANWTETYIYFICEGHPILKLPRQIKLPYTIEYKNGIRKVFRPDGKLSKEFQVLRVNNKIYRIGTETYYNENGKPSIVHTYEYFPDSIPGRINDSLLTKVTHQDIFKKGKISSRSQYRHRLKNYKSCNCGTWINYTTYIKKTETIYQNCYDSSWECK